MCAAIWLRTFVEHKEARVALQRNAATRTRLVKYPYFPTIMFITRSVVENYGRLDIFIPTIIPT